MLLLNQEKEVLYNLNHFENIRIDIKENNGIFKGMVIAKGSETVVLCSYPEKTWEDAEIDAKIVFHEMVTKIASNAEMFVTPLHEELGLLQKELLKKYIFDNNTSLESEICRAKFWNDKERGKSI